MPTIEDFLPPKLPVSGGLDLPAIIETQRRAMLAKFVRKFVRRFEESGDSRPDRRALAVRILRILSMAQS
jgi:hypothetical protein